MAGSVDCVICVTSLLSINFASQHSAKTEKKTEYFECESSSKN